MTAKADPNITGNDYLRAASHYNPIFSNDSEKTAVNVQSVLCFLHDHITDGEDPGISEERSYGAALILKCVISALDAHIEFGKTNITPAQEV